MTAWIIDTNVPKVATGRNTHSDLTCQLACVNTLESIFNGQIIAIDSLGLIVEEYRRHLNFSGEPTSGDKFFKYVFTNQNKIEKCIKVNITPTSSNNSNFYEFPTSPALNDFDTSDKKFVAVAVACPVNSIIYNATDTDWREYEDALEDEGIVITFLCPQHA